MTFSSYMAKRIIDLLNDRRIVVWYDAEGDFKTFIETVNVPNTTVLFVEESVLKTRRQADDVYRLMIESENAAESDRCLLIYIPHRRGATEDEKMRDPFEVYAIAGTAFGDTEDQKIESLAKQALPDSAGEITRLFREGKPNITLLDGLEKAQRWPLLNDIFGTETPAEIVALALCDVTKTEKVDEKPGCIEELLRLFESAVGFRPVSTSRKWKTLRPKAAEYVLFSEFAFDSPQGVPDALGAVPRASSDSNSLVYAACDRMRGDSSMIETYVELAQQIEDELRLPDLIPKNFNSGERDTFPFEEVRLLGRTVELVIDGDLSTAGSIIENRKRSVWRRDPGRSPAWTALDRSVALSESSEVISTSLKENQDLAGLIVAYTEGGWSNLDRAARLFEAALTACTDDEIVASVVEPCRRRYRESAVSLQNTFLAAVQAVGWPPNGVPRQTQIFRNHIAPLLERRKRTAFFMVDSLRYEMGRDLAAALAVMGEVDIKHAAGVLPTVTDCGMAALMPGADGMLRLVRKDGDLIPALGSRLLKTSLDRMKLLAENYGDRFFATTLGDLLSSPKKIASNLKNAEIFVVRTQDPDALAENLSAWSARKYISDVIGDIATAVRWAMSQGFDCVVISSDHGHMMLPEIPAGDVVQTPPGEWLGNKRRCRLGSGLSGAPGTVTLKAGHVGIQGDVEDICLPIGFRVFSEGDGYFHGGLSLQEAVVPVITFRGEREKQSSAEKPEIDIRYRSDKFTSSVVGVTITYRLQQLGAFGDYPNVVLIEAYDGTGSKAKVVGAAADCEARDDKTREVTLQPNKETPVPVLIDPDFNGAEIEIRVIDPRTRIVWAKRKLQNAILD